jgi:hypothetical protein
MPLVPEKPNHQNRVEYAPPYIAESFKANLSQLFQIEASKKHSYTFIEVQFAFPLDFGLPLLKYGFQKFWLHQAILNGRNLGKQGNKQALRLSLQGINRKVYEQSLVEAKTLFSHIPFRNPVPELVFQTEFNIESKRDNVSSVRLIHSPQEQFEPSWELWSKIINEAMRIKMRLLSGGFKGYR